MSDLYYLPNLSAQLGWRDLKLKHKSEPPKECLVNVLNEVGGENDDPWEPLNLVEQYPHVHISIPVR